MSRLRSWIYLHRQTLRWMVPIVVVSAIVQAVNLGGSPQRIDDEGTYTAQAWAVTHLGSLAHYTYWYDHPPLGWLQIAAWTGATGGFERYAVAVVAAREAMVVAALISVVLVWSISRRIGLSRAAAGAAAVVFAISPLAVQFHRTVYLDNVATPWMLGSILLAMTRRNQLAGFAASSAMFAVAVLSKETYLLALPLMLWLMISNARPETRRYTLAVAGTVLAVIGSSYVLLALVKNELLPSPNHTSLIEGLSFQLGSRESSGSILDPESLITATTGVWFQLDPVLCFLAPLSAVAGIAIRRIRPFAILLAFLIAFMFRPGGYLPVPYVIMMLPLAAIVIAGVSDRAVRSWRRRAGTHRLINVAWASVALAATLIAAPLWGIQLRGLLLADLDRPSLQAQAWIATNVPKDSRLIVDDTMWVDLVAAGFERDNVIWFYKLDTDSAVVAQSPNGWRDSDYVVTTDSMRSSPNAASANDAISSSVVVASFGEGDQQVDVRRIHSDGDAAAQQLSDDRTALRAEAGAQILENPQFTGTDSVLSQLESGQVDERISVVLGQLLAAGEVSVADFPIITGEDSTTLRQVLLDRVGGEPLVSGGELTAAGTVVAETAGGRLAAAAAVPTPDGILLTFSVVAPEGIVQ